MSKRPMTKQDLFDDLEEIRTEAEELLDLLQGEPTKGTCEAAADLHALAIRRAADRLWSRLVAAALHGIDKVRVRT